MVFRFSDFEAESQIVKSTVTILKFGVMPYKYKSTKEEITFAKYWQFLIYKIIQYFFRWLYILTGSSVGGVILYKFVHHFMNAP